MSSHTHLLIFFFFNDTATTEIYTLSLHDALPISDAHFEQAGHGRGTDFVDLFQLGNALGQRLAQVGVLGMDTEAPRSEEHTSELQSQSNLVCRLLLEKKKIVTARESMAKQYSQEL